MLDKNFIKPIPKKMVALIKREDKKRYSSPNGNTRFYSYLATWKKELVKITVAVRHYRKQWVYKQVAIHGLRSENCLARDIEFFYIGGYVVGWYDMGLYSRCKDWEDGIWYSCERKYFNPWSITVNLEYLERFSEYKYSEYKNAAYADILGYLRLYEQFPESEYLTKSGLKYYALSKTILRQIRKDKSFHKWLIANKDYHMERGWYYCKTLLQAYKKHLPIKQVQAFEERKKGLIHDYYKKVIPQTIIKKGVKGEYERYFHYIDKNNINEYLYRDYIQACSYLHLDCHDDKIRYPKDFKRWHDIRIEEMDIIRKEEERKARILRNREQRLRKKQMEKEKLELAENFLKAAEKYLPLAGFTEDEHYAIFIAKSPAELVIEGNALSHCVGRSGYDRKMANEETLIFFVRKMEELDKPFVTLEYSIKQKEVLQCYAYDNEKPEDKVLEFVNNKWLPYANHQLEQLAA